LGSTGYLLSRVSVIMMVVFLVSCLVMPLQVVLADYAAFSSIADAYLDKSDPNTNKGSFVMLDLESGDPSYVMRILLRFDLSSIPAGSTINVAYLQLYYDTYGYNDPAGRTLTVYRATKDWVETECSWNVYKVLNPWTAPGGDFSSDGASSNTVPSSVRQLMTWDVTAIVRAWILGGQLNHGFLIRDPNDDATFLDSVVYFHSRENSEYPPVLKVDWSTSRPVGGIAMSANKFEILAPYLALAGLVAVVSTVVVVRKRSRD
jgi:hypothetical protein